MTTRTDTTLVLLAAATLVAGFTAGRSELFRAVDTPAHMEKTALAELDHGDPTDAFATMRKIAGKGDASAAYHLGLMYEYGEGTKPDAALAIKWLTRAADSGSVAAARQLGTLHLDGTDAVQDFGAARDWFAVAARAGDRTALRDLGEMNAEGFGAPADPVKAYAYYAAAAARGDAHAAALRDRIATRLDPQQQSRGEAEARTILAGITPTVGNAKLPTTPGLDAGRPGASPPTTTPGTAAVVARP